MSHYDLHLFFCCNRRPDTGGNRSCAASGAEALYLYAKDRLKTLDPHKSKRIRINSSGCLGHCDDGPALVIYPEGVWYRYHNEQDIDDIIAQHILSGKIVERLLM